MMRALLEALASLREDLSNKRGRSKKTSVPRRRTILEVEPLEDRWLLAATLLWVFSANTGGNGTWSDERDWADMDTGNDAVPANGDTLLFDPSKTAPGGKQGSKRGSINDMAGLSVANLTLAAGYTDIVPGGFENSTVTMNNDLTVTGNVTIADGQLYSPNGKLLNVPNAGSTFTFSGGTIGVWVNLGNPNVFPTLTINGTADKTIDGQGFYSSATATWTGTGNLAIKNGGQLYVQPGSSFDIQTDADILAPGGNGVVDVYGTLKKTGTGITTVGTVFKNRGRLLLDSGTMDFTNTFSQINSVAPLTSLNGGNFISSWGFNLNAGKLEGNGTIGGHVWSDGGEVVPGIDGFPGQLTITESYTMTSESQLTINLTNGDTSILNLPSSSPDLAGTLRVNRSADYKPVKNTILTIITFPPSMTPGFSGNFSTFDIPNNDWSAGGVDHLFFDPITERGPYELLVRAKATETGMASDSNPGYYGIPVTLTAVVQSSEYYPGTPTGTVTFLEGTDVLGIASLDGSGTATLVLGSLEVGEYEITAVYSGDGNFPGSTSAVLTQTVEQNETFLTLESSASSQAYGEPVTFTAPVDGLGSGVAPTGTVQFWVIDALTGALLSLLGTDTLDANGQATLTTSSLAEGTHRIKAVYLGDSHYHGSEEYVDQEIYSP